MNLLEQFGEIRERAERGLPSALRFEAEGRELTRNFLPNERLILARRAAISRSRSVGMPPTSASRSR